MPFRSKVYTALAPVLRRSPKALSAVRRANRTVDRAITAVADHIPMIIRPDPRQLAIAITAQCNLSCTGCRYGRDFMVGSELPLPKILEAIADAGSCGFSEVRLYGGEPLLRKDLPEMVRAVVAHGMKPYVTTNAILLGKRIDALYEAGLRIINIGFYGVEQKYNNYVGRNASFKRMEESIATVRERYGTSIFMRINWLLMRPSCNIPDFDAAYRFAEKYDLKIQLDLVHYSLPYFTEGPDRELQFRSEDRPAVEAVVSEILARKKKDPDRFIHSETAIRSIPDWVILGPAMRVPCDANRLVWVGADGTVQLCYVTFRLGNLHEQRLSEMMFSEAHRKAARGAFELDCPNCHCGYDGRVEKHGPSAKRYAPSP